MWWFKSRMDILLYKILIKEKRKFSHHPRMNTPHAPPINSPPGPPVKYEESEEAPCTYYLESNSERLTQSSTN